MPDDAPLRFTDDWTRLERLGDGTRVRLRLLRPEDRKPLVDGFVHLSPESRYRRFFTAMPRLPESMVRRLLDVDGGDRLAIVAEPAAKADAPAGFWGIARFSRLRDTPATAEASVAVVDSMHRRGLGKLLLSELAAAARERGITHFQAEVQRTNEAMNALVHDLAASAKPTYRGTVAVYDVSLPEAGEAEGPIFHFLRAAGAGLSFAWRSIRRTKPSGKDENRGDER